MWVDSLPSVKFIRRVLVIHIYGMVTSNSSFIVQYVSFASRSGSVAQHCPYISRYVVQISIEAVNHNWDISGLPFVSSGAILKVIYEIRPPLDSFM